MKITFHTIALAGTMLAGPAFAQDDRNAGSDIVVLGTRTVGRSATESPAPIDSYSSDDLLARGLNDLPRALQFLAPSFNYARSATAPSAANTRAATLRGLSPARSWCWSTASAGTARR